MRGSGMHRLVYHGEGFVGRFAFGIDEGKSAAQQAMQFRRRGALVGHQAEQGIAAPEMAHGAIGNVLRGTARLRRGLCGYRRQCLRQGGAALHQRHRACGAEQAEGKRIRLQ